MQLATLRFESKLQKCFRMGITILKIFIVFSLYFVYCQIYSRKSDRENCREWKLTTVDPQERSTWRSGVRSAMRAASQLPGKGPTDVDDAPAPAR